jgi:PTS system beta-glucosides-specific IIC component
VQIVASIALTASNEPFTDRKTRKRKRHESYRPMFQALYLGVERQFHRLPIKAQLEASNVEQRFAFAPYIHHQQAGVHRTKKGMEMADDKNAAIAAAVLQGVGGKENVTRVVHCMTRLRFTLKDTTKADTDAIEKTPGVLGVKEVGEQYQVIIGQNVPKVYDALCAEGGFAKEDAIDENLDDGSDKKKLTWKTVGTNILDYLSGTMVQMIPLMIAAAMFRCVNSIFGPTMLNWYTSDSNIYILFNAVYQAGFYFMPIYLGYAAAKKLGVSQVIGMLIGGILIAPSLVELAGQPLTVYGIPTTIYNYAQTVLPIILSVWVMSYVERFFNKYIPESLSTIFVPVLTVAVMVPLELCFLAPLGNYLSYGLAAALSFINGFGGAVAMAVCGALWEFFVMTGMHVVIGTLRSAMIIQDGSVNGVFIAERFATVAVWGKAFGAFLRIKDKDEKNLAFSYFLSGIVGGVTEPALYGLAFRHKRTFVGKWSAAPLVPSWLASSMSRSTCSARTTS